MYTGRIQHRRKNDKIWIFQWKIIFCEIEDESLEDLLYETLDSIWEHVEGKHKQ